MASVTIARGANTTVVFFHDTPCGDGAIGGEVEFRGEITDRI